MNIIDLYINSNLSLSQLGLPDILYSTGLTKKIKPEDMQVYLQDIECFLRDQTTSTDIGNWLYMYFNDYQKMASLADYTIPLVKVLEDGYDLAWIVLTSDWVYSQRATTIRSFFICQQLSDLGIKIHKIIYVLPYTQETLSISYQRHPLICNGSDFQHIQQQWLRVGAHVSCSTDISKSLDQRDIAVYQIFISPPKSAKIALTESQIIRAHDYIQRSKKIVYVHAPYTLNVSGDTQQAYEVLTKHMEIVDKIGLKGLVFHVGKGDLDKMRDTIIRVLKNNYRSHLILETPAGQGRELLVKKNDFVDFFVPINRQYPNFKICIDTCHIYAAGVDEPLDYFIGIDPKSIALVHLNDSRTPCGSCLDRHAWRGRGHIGLDKLYRVVEYCNQHDIHMVNE